jgi:hypothetical protein
MDHVHHVVEDLTQFLSQAAAAHAVQDGAGPTAPPRN